MFIEKFPDEFMFECKFTMHPQIYKYFFEGERPHRVGYVSSTMFSHLSYEGSYMLMVLSYDYQSYVCLDYGNRITINREQMDQIRTEGFLELYRFGQKFILGC